MEALATTLRPMEVGESFVTKLAAETAAPGRICWDFLNDVLSFPTVTDRDLALSTAATAAKVLKDSGENGTPYQYVSTVRTIVKAAANGFSIDDSLPWNKLAAAARDHKKGVTAEKAAEKAAKAARVAKGEALQAAEKLLGVDIADAEGDTREILLSEVQRQMQAREQKELDAAAYDEAKRIALRLYAKGGGDWLHAVAAALFNHADALEAAAEKAEQMKPSE